MTSNKLVVFSFVLMLVNLTQCAKILGVFPLPSNSHYTIAKSLMRGLAEKGHDVTVISPFGEKNFPKNGSYKDIILTDLLGQNGSFDLFVIEKMNFIAFQLFMNFFGNFLTDKTLAHPNVQNLLKSDETFDVVIVEQFVNDALKGFAYHYNAHLVAFVTFGSNAWINTLVANPAPPSYVAEQAIDLKPSNFFDRLQNNLIYLFGELNRNFLFYPAQNKILKQYFPDSPNLEVLLYNISLVFLNSHISTNKAVPRVPNMIDIGGIHLQPPKKLPQDLQEYLDSAKEGVIYFSMGSTLESKNLPAEKRDIFLKVFSRLKQKVLWKWEDDVLPGQPPNVKLGKWLPQQDILAHSNVKAFITHGGLLSFIEAVNHGVPVLAIPVFGDQVINAMEAAAAECGRYVLYSDITEQILEEALNDVLNNKRYKENVKSRSKIMKDRQQSPTDDVDYWIKYVIRHRGAAHLRVAGIELPWYQYLSLDVYAFLVGTIILSIYLLYKILKLINNLLRKKKKLKVKSN